MKTPFSILTLVLMLVAGIMLVGCPSDEERTGTLQFYAEGEERAREGLVSKDGWSISFDHIYVTLSDITAYQTDPPYDPYTQVTVDHQVRVSLEGTYTVDLAKVGSAADPRKLVGQVSNQPAGHYNALSWRMVKAASGPAIGYCLLMIGIAEKDGEIVEFTIGVDQEVEFRGGEYVGDERKGMLEPRGTADLEMTFHLDHIFGDGLKPADDEINLDAFDFEALLADPTIIDLVEVHLGHVGEGHCRVIPLG
ncbi:MAG: DUF4382 domain-containing protein [Dehalococcoidia bacterium]|nr:DUF4382 domain-containing protein [Dehalococcoidia bacterium]